jgi:DNA (cytosine-5)-methyltransferase 1
MTAYYNEHDPFAASWLRELIADNIIAPGEVDERDIRDVKPDELRPFSQVHLFAGIGIWSSALRYAGWPDDRDVWTVSCPCQPFSAAGFRGGFGDERHLWPAAFHLAFNCRPDVLLGEQVASKDGLAWIDLVSADMEAAGYAGGAFDLCSAGFGAPNIRQRLYFVWMAHTYLARPQRWRGMPERAAERLAGPCGLAGGVADADGRNAGTEGLQRGGEHGQRPQDRGSGRVDNAGTSEVESDGGERRGMLGAGRDDGRPGPVNGFWRNADWIGCTDGKWRPVEPGSFPLASGSIPNRVAKLRGAGNALNREVAQGFIETVTEYLASLEQERIAA